MVNAIWWVTASTSVFVLLGNGDGTFQPGVGYVTGVDALAQPNSLAIADVNGDGKPDLLVSGWDNEYNGLLGVLIGNGDGSFQPVVSYSTGPGESFAESVAVADLNGD